MPSRRTFGGYVKSILCSLIPPSSDVIKSDYGSFARFTTFSIPSVPPPLPNRKPMRRRETILRSLSTQSQPTPPIKLTFGEQMRKSIRMALKCDDTYAKCKTDSDCGNSTLKCFNNQCIPNVSHCSISKCSDGETCNMQTGECESTRSKCSTDTDCGQNGVCDEGECYHKEGFCRNDFDCIGVEKDGKPLIKCDTESKKCVECNFGQPSKCAEIDPTKPSCHITKHICFHSCDPIVPPERSDPTDENGCCTVDQVASLKAKTLAPWRLENCCKNYNQTTYLNENIWGGVDKCCLDDTNSGPETGRLCTNWAGRDRDHSCCEYFECDVNTGKCVKTY